jgi:hypothetical protein
MNRTALAFIAGVLLTGGIVKATEDAPRVENQPHMQNALAALNTAKDELKAATADKGGHRKAAIENVEQAIEQVKKGIEADNDNGKDKGKGKGKDKSK